MALKLDISKVYDRVSWEFLRHVMLEMGFENEWIELIMMCVSTVTHTMLVNGQEVGPIVPGRGLRLGDPLSPYLFILCAKGLSSLIEAAKNRGEIHGCNVSKGAPIISHLFFADDNFLFFKATKDKSSTIKRVLLNYEMIFGQVVNF